MKQQLTIRTGQPSDYLYLIMLLLLFAAADSYGLTSLTISEPAGTDRISEPVTSGIPLPESANIQSIENLYLTDDRGNIIPAQYTVLSRWGGTPDDGTKAIKWVLLDFQVDMDADTTKTCYLKQGAGGSASGSNLHIQDSSDKIIVETGKARFQISKDYFNLFDYVWFDADNDGQAESAVISQMNEGGVVLTDKSGKQFSALLEKPGEIVIEEKGPMRSVIKIRGVLKSRDGSYFAPSVHSTAFDQPYQHSFVYYNCRLHFYNDQDYVKVFFTLENNGANGRTNPEQYFAPIQAVYFDSVNLSLRTAADAAVELHSENTSAQLNSDDVFTLYQDWHENLTDSKKDTLEPGFADGIFYISQKNTAEISRGQTHPGWIDVKNSQGENIAIAIRHFWQNFPKKITVKPGEIAIGLWPSEGYYPYCTSADYPDSRYDMYCREAGKDGGVYLFDAGRHKTYEMAFRFYHGSDNNASARLSAFLEAPLMAVAPPEWYVKTRALGMIGPGDTASPDPEINEAMQRFEQHQRAMVYEKDSENGKTILNLKTANPPYWEYSMQNRFFNWMNFGDLTWSGQAPAALHYDWPYSMLLHFIRTGGRNFFKAGTEMTKHRYDTDQYHGSRSGGNDKAISHMAFYESSGHGDPTLHSVHPSKVSFHSHTWNGGLLLYYLLTGDKKAWEAAEENGQAAISHYGTGGLFDADIQRPARHETRMETWAMLNLIHLYRVSGNSEYIRIAKNIAKNRMLVREQAAGGKGYFGDGDDDDIDDSRQYAVMFKYAIEAMVSVSYETRDPELRELLIRMADFIKDMFLFGGNFNGEGQYMPLQGTWVWHKNDPDGSAGLASLDPEEPAFYNLKRDYSAEPVVTFFWADLFAYAYQLTGDTEYLDWARRCFRDSIFYYDKEGKGYNSDGYIDPLSRARLSYIDAKFPDSRTKIHGWVGRSNQIYLYTEWQLTAPSDEPPVADFSADINAGEAPLTVQFTDKSLNFPFSWEWDFDNDGIADANEQHPVHTYSQSGVYAVSLTVKNSFGTDSRIISDYIHIADIPGDSPSARISMIRKDCSGLQNCYSSLSEWQADFGGIDFAAFGCETGDLICANAIAVAECYNDWPEGLHDGPEISGWQTDEDHYVKIYTPLSERHSGRVYEDGQYSGFAVNLTAPFYIRADYTLTEGIIFNLQDNGRHISLGAWDKGGMYSVFRNNITYNGRYRHLFLGDYQAVNVYNNLLINDTERKSGYGMIDCGPSDTEAYHRIYNNSLHIAGDYAGIDGHSLHHHLEIMNNFCYKDSGNESCYSRFDPEFFQNNISSDVSASDILSLINQPPEDK